MTEWKYIKTIDDLPTEYEEYLVVLRETNEALECSCKDYVTVATFEPDQKLWRLDDNWYLNPLLTLDGKDRNVRCISHWMWLPEIPEEVKV